MSTQIPKMNASTKNKKPPYGDAAGAVAFAKTAAQRNALAPEEVIRPLPGYRGPVPVESPRTGRLPFLNTKRRQRYPSQFLRFGLSLRH